MACRGCSSSNTNQRKYGSYGCRKALQDSRWSGCTNYGCNPCTTGSCGTNNGCMHYCGCHGCTNGCSCHCSGNNNCTNSCHCGTNNNCTNGCHCGTNNNCTNSCHCGTNNGCAHHCGCHCCTDHNCMNNCGCHCGTNNGCIQPRGTSASCSNSPYYNGPCGPVEPVRCCTSNCPNQSNCGCCSHSCNCCHTNCCGAASAVYGYFTQEGCLEIAAGGVVPFNGTSSSVGILKSGGELTLTEGGAYMISLSVNIPANVTLKTEFNTLIDDGIAAGGSIIIDKTQTNAPLHAHTQTVISVAAGSVIRIVSSEAVNLSCGDQIVVLNIAKVG